MKVQRIYLVQDLDTEASFRNIESMGGRVEERPNIYYSCYKIVLKGYEDITILLQGDKLSIFYDDETHDLIKIIDELQRCLRNKDGKPAKLAFFKENPQLRQKVAQIVALTKESLEMRSPRGDIVSIRVRCGTICGSIAPSGHEDWLPLDY